MPTSNGPWQNHRRVEWAWSVGSISAGTSSVAINIDAYLRAEQSWNEGYTGSVARSGTWGSASKSFTWDFGTGGERVRFINGGAEAPINLTLTDAKRTVSVSATANHYFGSTSSTLSFEVPGRYALTPGTPSTTLQSGNKILVEWSRSSTYTSVVVERRVKGGSWSQVAVISGNAASWTDSSVAANSYYEYRVAGRNSNAPNGVGQSGWAYSSARWTAPAAPSSLTATKQSDSRINLAWKINAVGATSTRIERRVNGGSWSLLTTVSGTGTSYADTSVVANRKYEYRVSSVNPGGTSAASSVATRWTSPAAPSGFTATRSSDANHALSWTSNAYGATQHIVQRNVNDGSYSEVSRPTGTSLTATGGAANRKYTYRVSTVTPGGASSWVYSSPLYTTPAAPTGVSAERISSTQIRVDASGRPPYATSYDVEDNGSVVATSVSLPWTHSDPNPAVSHAYKVRAKRGSLVSGWSSASNTVQLLAPPNAPSNLSPNGAVVDYAGSFTLSWRHNPVDSSQQTQRQIRRRLVGASSWIESGQTTTSAQSVVVDGSWAGDPGSYEWQVRTRGQHATWSPWSATATFTTINAPTVAINSPDTLWESSLLVMDWTYDQAQSRPQSAWQVSITEAGGQPATNSGSGSQSSYTFGRRVTPGMWTVGVRVATGGVWSEWAESTFEVVFHPPAAPIISGAWDESRGITQLYFQAGDDPGMPETARLVVERSVDGEVWEPVIATDELDSSVSDGESLSYGVTQYRVTALTVEDEPASTEYSVEAASPAVWLSGGQGFLSTARLPLSPEITVSSGRARQLVQYAGRRSPVAYAGEHVSRTVRVAGRLLDHSVHGVETADMERLIDVVTDAEPVHLLRTPDGVRMYGEVGAVDLPRTGVLAHESGWNGIWGYSVEVTETEAR